MTGNRRPTAVAVPLRVAGAALLLAVFSGCAVSQPDAKDWDKQAETSLTDAASEVATARLVLQTAAREKVWPPYAVVVLSDAEESAGRIEEDLARLQVPSARRDAAEDVLDLLDAAATGVREARQAAVDGSYGDAALDEKLRSLKDALEGAASKQG